MPILLTWPGRDLGVQIATIVLLEDAERELLKFWGGQAGGGSGIEEARVDSPNSKQISQQLGPFRKPGHEANTWGLKGADATVLTDL